MEMEGLASRYSPIGSPLPSPSALNKSILGQVAGGLVGSGVGSEQKEKGAKKPGQVAQDQAQVVAGAAQQRMGARRAPLRWLRASLPSSFM